MSENQSTAATELTAAEEVMGRARRGDQEALPALRKVLDDHPETWQAYGDVAAHARQAWVALIGGSDLAMTESVTRKAAAMRTELADPSATLLEGLLADRVVACWLQVHFADAAVAQSGVVSLAQGAYAQKRQDAAHRRYLAAIGTLATVRRLLPTALETGFVVAAEVPQAFSDETSSVDGPGEDALTADDGFGGDTDARSSPGSVLAFRARVPGNGLTTSPRAGRAAMSAVAT